MAKRKALSQSMRWHVFARDGFCCRYCGVMAGQDGVELAIDHVVSVAEGGGNHPDNLVSACKSCNSGKSSRSLESAPTTKQVVKRIRKAAANMRQQADAISDAIDAEAELRQQIVNMKCAAYDTDRCTMKQQEVVRVRRLVAEFGADTVLTWYQSAASNGCKEWDAVRYISGCARHTRERANA